MSIRRLDLRKVVLISAVLASALLGFSAVVPAQSAVGGTSISASKTMTGHLVSSYAWTLSKSASPSTLTLDAGQSAAVQYTVGATRSAPSMSAYFDGQICVKNTGSFATQGLRIVDSVSKPPKQTVLASTVVDVSANPVLTPGESHCYAYRVDLTTGVVPGATYKDTATVTITNKSGKTSGSAPSATTTLPTTIGTVNNASITVADTNGSTFTFSGTGTASYSQSFGCPADAGTHTNTISAPGFASAGASVTVTCSSPDLSLTKVADAASVDAGSPVGFTVTVANGGSGSASGVSVSDPLPAVSGVNWSIESQTGNACAITGAVGSQVLSCAIGTLAPSASYAVHVTSPTSFASCAALPNTATLTATNSPTQTANASTTVVCSDLSLTKVADAALVIAGGPVGFTVTVANGAGSGTANGVSVSDPLAPSVNWSIESQTGNACSITGAVGSQVLSCTVGSLASGASYTVHVVAGTSPAACGVMSNTATLTSTNSPTQSANASVAVMCPNLAVVKTADADTVAAGSQVGFTVTVSNSAFGAANGVAISDPLPAGVDWSIQSQTGNGCSITGAVGSQVLSCAVGALADGASYSVHIVGASGPEDCGLMSNTATATATNDSTETSTATITITC